MSEINYGAGYVEGLFLSRLHLYVIVTSPNLGLPSSLLRRPAPSLELLVVKIMRDSYAI